MSLHDFFFVCLGKPDYVNGYNSLLSVPQTNLPAAGTPLGEVVTWKPDLWHDHLSVGRVDY